MLHKVGVEYLEKTGLDLIVWTSFGKATLQPGSAFENIEKEKLPTPYSIKLNNGVIYTLNENLQKRYQITTEVDLQRILRICSILVTNFQGPEEEDSPKNHREGIRQWIKDQSSGIDRIGFHMVMALHTLDEILGYKKHFDFSENFSFVNILRVLYKLWLNDPLEEFSIPKDLPKI
ncbi:MAG TPA: hypothetical protein VMX55_07065 [candidate division Zixibacteria bacterium]|nr:hypothetical protein [candidate division Zixibacteria bacterium]